MTHEEPREREREKTRKATKHADPRGKKNNILLFFFFFLRPLFIISSSSFPFSCFPVCFFLRRTGLEPKEKRSSRAPPSPTPPPVERPKRVLESQFQMPTMSNTVRDDEIIA